MLQYLKQTWNELWNGENIDLHITVFISIIITFLGLFGYAKPEIINPIISAILGLIASSMLSSRKTMNKVNSSTKYLSETTEGLNKTINVLEKRIDIKNQIYDTMANASSKLRDEIKGNEIKVDKVELIQHSSECVHDFILALFTQGVEEIELYLQDLSTAESLCEDTKNRIKSRAVKYKGEIQDNRYKGNFKLYLYESPASLNAIRLTLSNNQEIILLGWYTYFHETPGYLKTQNDINGGNNPCLRINSSHDDFSHFRKLFEKQIEKFKCQSEIRFSMNDGDLVKSLVL